MPAAGTRLPSTGEPPPVCIRLPPERGCGVAVLTEPEGVPHRREGNNPTDSTTTTYSQLLERVKRFAAVLRNKGVSKGDTVAIYQPMVVDLVVAMLACARIGAIHSIIFGGFSAAALADRIDDAKSKVVITAGRRRSWADTHIDVAGLLGQLAANAVASAASLAASTATHALPLPCALQTASFEGPSSST